MKPPDFSKLRILVMGDPIVDFYHWGRVDRMSPEAPVPVFIEERVEKRAGGALNVMNNLLELGCETDEWFPYRPWTEKHRYMVNHHQIMRVDKDQQHPELMEHDPMPLPKDATWDAIVVSDYAKGFVTRQRFKVLLDAIEGKDTPIIVDPKGSDWGKYAGATVMCPNHLEYQLRTYSSVVPVVEKRAEQGLRLHRLDHSTDFPAKAKGAFDVTGAGDTVTAVIAATLASGGTLEDACVLANLAAGYVVGEVGTATCNYAKLVELCA